jgi:ClpA/ClpB-like protein
MEQFPATKLGTVFGTVYRRMHSSYFYAMTKCGAKIRRTRTRGLEEFHHKQVEPLHLLAAALELPSRPEVDLLKRAGINEEDVRAKLKEFY